LLPLAVLIVPIFWMADHRRTVQAKTEAEVAAAFADRDRVIVIDMRGRG
jgi:hypothetical protein